eukprot:jgi/Chlat1/8625/Chrsp86S09236
MAHGKQPALAAVILLLLLGVCSAAVGHDSRRLLRSSSEQSYQLRPLPKALAGHVEKTDSGVFCYNGRAVPSVFLIGGQKCGSTTVHGYMVSPLYGKGYVANTTKEMHFIDEPHAWLDTNEWFDQYSQKYPECDDPLIAQEPVKYVMDGTPSYMRLLSAPLEIGAHYARFGLHEDLKFLVSLRDPVTRLLSWFHHIGRWTWHIECETTFDQWVAQALPAAQACIDNHENLSKQQIYLECGMDAPPPFDSPFFASWYVLQLEQWFRLFPPAEQFLVVDFRELETPEGSARTAQRVMEFLNIPYETPIPEEVLHQNAASQHHRCPPPDISPATDRALRDFFRPVNLEMRTLFAKHGIEDQLPNIHGT